MKNELLIIVSVFLSILIMATVIALLPRHGEVVYNCNIAEISPDYPVAVKEQCRKLRMEKK